MTVETKKRTNGVEVERLHETVNAVKETSELGLFTFHLANRWLDGAKNSSQVTSFQHKGEAVSHSSKFDLAADEPGVLLGADSAANPVEHLLHALASCVTTSMVYHAAARGIPIERVESALEGDIDLRGFLGLDPTVRNGCQQIRLKLRVKANLDDDRFQELSSLGPTFSPVFDSLRNGVPMLFEVERI
jgi:uncharacterized OsmC-like protein